MRLTSINGTNRASESKTTDIATVYGSTAASSAATQDTDTPPRNGSPGPTRLDSKKTRPTQAVPRAA